jgi:hypothetical protein
MKPFSPDCFRPASLRLSLTAAAIAIAIPSLAGCVADDPAAEPHVQAAVNQKYSLGEVRERLDKLEPGMTKREVLLTLGSPAVRRGTYWEYWPERSGTMLPATAIRVLFEGELYAGRRIVPIVLGEELD